MSRLDMKGRVLIPASIRQQFGISAGTEVEFYTNGTGEIIIKKVTGCIVCGKPTDRLFRRKRICPDCR